MARPSCSSSHGFPTVLHFVLVGIFGMFLCQVPCNSSDPCLNAIKIGDSRRSPSYAPSVQDPLLCDANLNESLWYRFDAITGGKMPESCVTTLHCGTMLPIWMNDVHPHAASPGPKTVKVCAPYWVAEVNCCDWSETITVNWCLNKTTFQEYFVYQLKKPPFCSMSYCAGFGLACDKDCSWNGIKISCSCPAYPAMTSPILNEPRLVTGAKLVRNAYPPGELFHPARFVVDCVIGYPQQMIDDGARFDVIFEADGLYITRFTANSTNPVSTLDESYLIGYLGRTLTCRVSSYWDSSDAGSKYLLSNKRWFGLSPVNEAGLAISNNLVVKEGQTVSFWLQPSFPITTRPCFDVPQFPCFYRAYSFSIHASDSVMRMSDCALVVAQGFPRSGEVKISPIPTIGGRPKPFIWQLNFDVYNDTIMSQKVPGILREKLTPIFNNYQIQSVNIEIVDPDPQPLCQSTGDPHILAFPDAAGKRAYYHIYSVGVFYLVRSTSRLLEIQVNQVPCNPTTAVPVSCNCGVIVREGNSIIGIDACKSVTSLLVNYKLDKISPTGTIETTPTGWKITLLSGIEINANIAGWEKRFMDIYVNGLKSELTQYDGLCSVQGLDNVECTTACDRHRVPESDSFFNINSKNLPKCGLPYFVPTCQCYGKNIDQSVNVTCAQPKGDVLLPIDLTRVCAKRKRAADSAPSSVDSINLDDLNYAIPPTFLKSVQSIFPTDSPFEKLMASIVPGQEGTSIKKQLMPVSIPKIKTEEAALKCRESLKNSSVYDLCTGRIDTSVMIDTCILDVKLLNHYGPADSVATQVDQACVRSIRLSLEDPATKNIEELRGTLRAVEKMVCPSQCSHRGKCENGVCLCNAGYIGVDCSVKQGQAPSVIRIISPVCDIRKQPCKTIYLQATDFASSDTVSCKMRSENDDFKGFPTIQYSKPSISGGVAVCSLPLLPFNSNDQQPSETTYKVQVSLSNDGQNYSNELLFTVLDSRCFNCSAKKSK